jgi:flagella basal body P-ring formation protein FlgA
MGSKRLLLIMALCGCCLQMPALTQASGKASSTGKMIEPAKYGDVYEETWKVPAQNDTEELILKKAHELLEQHFDPDKSRFELTARWIPRRLLGIDSERIQEVRLAGGIDRYTNFDVLFQSGQKQRKVQIQLAVDLEQKLPVAIKRLSSGSKISKNDIRMQWKRTPIAENYVTDKQQLIGKTLRKTLVSGQPIRSDYIGADYIIKAGDKVRLIVEKKGLRIEIVAEARENGAKGESIRVYSDETRRKYVGQIISEGIVKWKKTL